MTSTAPPHKGSSVRPDSHRKTQKTQEKGNTPVQEVLILEQLQPAVIASVQVVQRHECCHKAPELLTLIRVPAHVGLGRVGRRAVVRHCGAAVTACRNARIASWNTGWLMHVLAAGLGGMCGRAHDRSMP